MNAEKHSPPIDGTVTNGHALVPFTFPPGPVSGWPQDNPGQSRTVADKAERRRPDGDTVIRVLAAIVVLAVAAFAAIVSYSHIFELGRHHGQDGTAARLLPLSVDGLIAAASLVMLHAARRKLDVPVLARWMLGLGVGATVAANVEYGMPFGWLAAVVSAWPAVAFVGSVEMAVRFVRDARQDGAVVPLAAAPVVTPRHDSDHDSKDDKPPARPAVRPRPGPSGDVTAASKIDRARVILRDNPGLKNRELVALTGGDIDVRTFQRARNGKTGSTT